MAIGCTTSSNYPVGSLYFTDSTPEIVQPIPHPYSHSIVPGGLLVTS